MWRLWQREWCWVCVCVHVLVVVGRRSRIRMSTIFQDSGQKMFGEGWSWTLLVMGWKSWITSFFRLVLGLDHTVPAGHMQHSERYSKGSVTTQKNFKQEYDMIWCTLKSLSVLCRGQMRDGQSRGWETRLEAFFNNVGKIAGEETHWWALCAANTSLTAFFHPSSDPQKRAHDSRLLPAGHQIWD